MKHFLIVLFLFSSFQIFSQELSPFEKLIKQGIEFHDNGEYEKAIAEYTKALEIDPNSSLALYELAYSHFENGEYNEAISYSERVIEANDNHKLYGYLILGSALDMSNQTEKANEIFLEAIDDLGPHHLFYYNLSVNYANDQDYEKSKMYASKALEMEASHLNSHWILVLSDCNLGNKTQCILASSMFLYIQDEDPRADNVYNYLQENLKGNVEKQDGGGTVITMEADKDIFYSSLDLMISLMESGVESDNDEALKELTDNRLNFLLSLFCDKLVNDEDAPQDIYKVLHGPVFYAFDEAGFLELITHIIQYDFEEDSQIWFENNGHVLEEFATYLDSPK